MHRPGMSAECIAIDLSPLVSMHRLPLQAVGTHILRLKLQLAYSLEWHS